MLPDFSSNLATVPEFWFKFQSVYGVLLNNYAIWYQEVNATHSLKIISLSYSSILKHQGASDCCFSLSHYERKLRLHQNQLHDLKIYSCTCQVYILTYWPNLSNCFCMSAAFMEFILCIFVHFHVLFLSFFF